MGGGQLVRIIFIVFLEQNKDYRVFSRIFLYHCFQGVKTHGFSRFQIVMKQSVGEFTASLQEFHIIPFEKPTDRMNHIVIGNQYGIGGHLGQIALKKPPRCPAVHGPVWNSKAPHKKEQQESATIEEQFSPVILHLGGP